MKSSRELAVHGGEPVRRQRLPYARQHLDAQDFAAVADVLSSDWLTTGPKVEEFERAAAPIVGSEHTVAIANGTAALHAAIFALRIGPGDEVIVPSLTFAATANCALYQGAKPVFADVEADTLLIDPASVEAKITAQTKAIIAVDYAGQPCDYETLSKLAEGHGLALVSDACHALGATYQGRKVGSLSDLSTFSFHPAKHITTAEGGLISTDDPELAARLRTFRNHGITVDHRQRAAQGSWFYEIDELGYNYRLPDLSCALGISQLKKLPGWIERRRQMARRYDEAFATLEGVEPLALRPQVEHAYHLYVVRLRGQPLQGRRAEIFTALVAEGIGVNVHYVPVHLHPLYRREFGTGPGLCPVTEAAYEEILSLPMFPAMQDEDVEDVVTAMHKVIESYY